MLKVLLIVFFLLYFGGKLLPRLGSLLGGHSRKPLRQAKWMLTWAAGSEEDAIRAEQEYGAECAREFSAQFRGSGSGAAKELVDAVGSKLAEAVKDPNRTFRFSVVRANYANAFALPGGFVFITEPLLALSGYDRDEIAFLLGHEVAHVTLGHARSQFAAGALLNAVTARLSGAGMLLREFLRKGYSRDLELEADREGARLAAAAGFDSGAGSRALERLAGVSADNPGLAEYFSSHPPFAERLKRLGTRVDG